MKTHKAILIDVKAETITEIQVGDYLDIQHKIGCDIFTIGMHLPDCDAIYVDDEGLLSVAPESKFFLMEGAHQPFVGNGLICGGDSEGETQNVKMTVDEVKKQIKFLTLAQAQLFRSVEDFA